MSQTLGITTEQFTESLNTVYEFLSCHLAELASQAVAGKVLWDYYFVRSVKAYSKDLDLKTKDGEEIPGPVISYTIELEGKEPEDFVILSFTKRPDNKCVIGQYKLPDILSYVNNMIKIGKIRTAGP